MWMPLIEPRVDDEDELFVPLGGPSAQVASKNWLASASDPLAPASQTAEDMGDDARVPMRRLMFSTNEVPDFAKIPRDRWREVMGTIPEALRYPAVQGLGLPIDDLVALGELAMSDLPPAPSDVAREQVRAKPRLAPAPAADTFRRANRQVNFRLTESEYLDLATAAELIGTTPTQLAGMLVRNGVRRVLEEANRSGG